MLNLPNPDLLPIFEETVANNEGAFEIRDADMNVVGTSSGDLARAAGVAEENGNRFFTFKSRAGTPTASDFFLLGQVRIANEQMGPADLREMTVRASLRMLEAPASSRISALGGTADPPMYQAVLTDENGDQMATLEQEVSGSDFQTSEFKTSEFDQPVGGSISIDLIRIVDLSFGFSASTPADVPELEFDVDNVSVPEPDMVLLQIAALVSLAALRPRTRSARKETPCANTAMR